MKNNSFIWILLLVAFIIRIPGIFDGLPAAYNSTEYFLAKTALGMGARQSLDPLVYVYPTLYAYLLLGLYVIIYVTGMLIGAFSNSVDFAVQFLINPSVFYLTGRTVNVLLSTLTVFIFYSQTRKLFGEASGRFAALTAGLSYYFVFYSRFAVADTLLILFSTLATVFILRAYLEPSWRNYAGAGVFTGLAIGTKYNAGFLVLGVLVVFILQRVEKRQPDLWKNVLVLGLSLLAGFFVFNPLWIGKFFDFWSGYRLISAQMQSAVALYTGKNYLWEMSQIIQHELVIGIGFFIGMLVAAIRRKAVHVILLLPIMFTFIYVGSWQKKGVDYLLAVFPAWILLFSLWLESLWLRFENRPTLKYVLFFLVFMPSVFMGLYQNILALNQDTREQATAWIMNHVEKDQKICYENYTFDLGLFDIRRYTEYGAGAAQLPDAVKQRVLDFADHPRGISRVPNQIKLDSGVVDFDNPYDAEVAGYGRKSLEQLQDEGVRYFISNSWYYGPYLGTDIEQFSAVMQQRIAEVRQFYRDIETTGRRIKIFQPDFWHPGPAITVYDISKSD
ncbi:MAG: glycosyltransferase family 39 protein [bacterium]|nr:MAG: glycosyltransferase family 39 protein [bacterium]